MSGGPELAEGLRARKIDLAGRNPGARATIPSSWRKRPRSSVFNMAPPENAIVLTVDEKPSIQALQRALGYLKLPIGGSLTGQSLDYKRLGTATFCYLGPMAFAEKRLADKERLAGSPLGEETVTAGKIIMFHMKHCGTIAGAGFAIKIMRGEPWSMIQLPLAGVAPINFRPSAKQNFALWRAASFAFGQ